MGSAGTDLGCGTTGKLGRAWVPCMGAWHGAWHYGLVLIMCWWWVPEPMMSLVGESG